MTDFSRRYRDYLTSADIARPPADEPDREIPESSVVVKRGDGTWHAVWQGKDGLLGEFDGTEQDAIEWARRKSTRCWVWSDAAGDLVLLDPDGDAGQR